MKIPNAIHKFVLHKKKKKYGKYVCTSSYRNKQKTNSRKSMLQLAKKIISQLFIRKNIVHNPIINVQKPGETPRKTSSRNWGLSGFQLATAEPAIDNRRARNWKKGKAQVFIPRLSFFIIIQTVNYSSSNDSVYSISPCTMKRISSGS